MCNVQVVRLGRLLYKDALILQKETVNRVKEKELDGVLLLLQHHPVFTIGIRTKDYDVVLKERLRNLGADFYEANRGGLITFHGPGQLVAYPIINLKHFGIGMKSYIHSLEEVVIQMCRTHFGLTGERSPHTGVWVNDRKLCAIGVHGSRYVTSHGLAVNCNTDLHWFDHITPCGIPDKGVTSLTQLLDHEVTVEKTIPCFLDAFASAMKCRVSDSRLFNWENVDLV